MNSFTKKAEQILATNLFEKAWYVETYSIAPYNNPIYDFLSQTDIVYKSPNLCFDAKWYLSNYHTEFDWRQIHPLVYYSLEGWKLGHNPSPNFSTLGYLNEHQDINDLGINPLEHFLKYGRSEGRAIERASNETLLSYENYLKRESAFINTNLFLKSWYTNCNNDIDFQNINPIQHYILYGIQEGRKPNPYFDPKWYVTTYKSAITPNINTIINYSKEEWKTNNPSPHFLNKEYLLHNPDAKDNNFEPLYHWLQFGIFEEGRSIYSYHNVEQLEPYLSPIKESTTSSSSLNRPVSKEYLDIHIIWEESTFLNQDHKSLLKTMQYAEMSGHKITLWYIPAFYVGNENFIEQQLYTQYGVSFQNIRTDFSYSNINKLNGDIIISNSSVITQSLLNNNCISGFTEKYFFLNNYRKEKHKTSILRHFHSRLKYITTKENLHSHIVNNLGLGAVYLQPLRHENLFNPIMANQAQEPVSEIKKHHKILYFYDSDNESTNNANTALETLKLLGYDFTVEVTPLGQSKDFGSQSEVKETIDLFESATIGLIVSSEALTSESLTLVNLDIPTVIVSNNLKTLGTKKLPFIHVSTQVADISQSIQKLFNEGTQNLPVNKVSLLPLDTIATNYKHLFKQLLISLEPNCQLNKQDVLPIVANNLKNQVDVSIIIPTYNGGNLLKKVIKAIQSQIYPAGFEIIIIDSESTDETRSSFRDSKDVIFHEIAKKDFNHGGTRNLGAELAQGDYVAFITQDAIPADNFWLYNLVSPLKTNPNAAGVFGRHIPYKDTSEFLKRDLNNHFDQFNQYPLVVSKNTQLPTNFQNNPDAWNHILWFYSDNNSCLRKSVWARIPLPIVSFGEDQLWAQRIIAAGYEKCYAPNAVVVHSHNFDYKEVYERSKIESEFHYKFFKYEHIKNETELESILEAINESDKQWGINNNCDLNEISLRIASNEAQLRGYLDGKYGNQVIESIPNNPK